MSSTENQQYTADPFVPNIPEPGQLVVPAPQYQLQGVENTPPVMPHVQKTIQESYTPYVPSPRLIPRPVPPPPSMEEMGARTDAALASIPTTKAQTQSGLTYNDIIYGIEDFPATQVFIIVLTVIIIIFTIPVWRRLSYSKDRLGKLEGRE